MDSVSDLEDCIKINQKISYPSFSKRSIDTIKEIYKNIA